MKINNNGMSLVEVIIAAALLGGLGVGAMKLKQNMTKTVATAESGSEVASITSDIRTMLSNPRNCEPPWGKNPSSDSSINSIVRSVLKRLATPINYSDPTNYNNFEKYKRDGTRYGQGNIKVEEYYLNDSDGDVSAAETTTHLYIKYYRGKASQSENTTRRIKIYYELNGSGDIKTCRALGRPSHLEPARK